MCYLVRQQASAEHGASAPTTEPGALRPRWVGAAAALLVGGVALAFVAPATAPERISVQEPSAALPVVARSTPVQPASVSGQSSLPADDGVPTAAGTVKAKGNCEYGL